MFSTLKRCLLALLLAILVPAATQAQSVSPRPDIRPNMLMPGHQNQQMPPGVFDEGALNTQNNDPFEWINRPIFAFNNAADIYFLEPLAKAYRYVAPKPLRTGIRNVVRNLQEPVNIINALLQGDVKHTGDSLLRFMVNSGFGIGGIIDVAAMHDIEFRDEDFGQTLAVWGVPSGPYIMFPLLGPTSPRQMVGRAIDGIAFDPFDYIAQEYSEVEGAYWILRGLNLVDIRARNIENVEALRQSTQDPYTVVRSIYWQQRALSINNGAPPVALDNAFEDAFE